MDIWDIGSKEETREVGEQQMGRGVDGLLALLSVNLLVRMSCYREAGWGVRGIEQCGKPTGTRRRQSRAEREKRDAGIAEVAPVSLNLNSKNVNNELP